jgi:hypothetical protein
MMLCGLYKLTNISKEHQLDFYQTWHHTPKYSTPYYFQILFYKIMQFKVSPKPAIPIMSL